MVTHFWHLPFVPWERSRPVRMNGRRTYDPEADGVETENANIRVLNSSQTWPARIWTRSIMHTLDDTRTNADQSPPHFEHGEHGNTTKVTAMFANDRSMTSTTVVRVYVDTYIYIYIYLYIHTYIAVVTLIQILNIVVPEPFFRLWKFHPEQTDHGAERTAQGKCGRSPWMFLRSPLTVVGFLIVCRFLRSRCLCVRMTVMTR